MRRLASLALALVALLPVAAAAETVRVRSGDHDGFTRLLVQFDAREAWVFGRVDGGFEFRSRRRDIVYGLDGIYQRIGIDRIADVRDLGDGRLFLAVDCACHAAVDELADGQVVLDIVAGKATAPGTGIDARLPVLEDPARAVSDTGDGGDRATVPAVPPVDTPARQAPARPMPDVPPIRLPVTFPATRSEPPAPARGDPPPGGGDTLSGEPSEAPARHPAAETPPALDPDLRARVTETQTALLEQIARAAAQGLLDADTGSVDRSIAAVRPPAATDPVPPPDIVTEQPPATPRGHVAIETSIDRAASRGQQDRGETDDGGTCIDPAHFDVPSWGSPNGNGADIGAYRSRMVGEFDVADSEGVTALARHYIYMTFGAEAAALIRRYRNEVERPDLLVALAEIIDDGSSSSAPELVDQMACAGATALWATLAQPELRAGQSINIPAVTLAFGSLPPHLRRHLGPALADRFLNIGDTATAQLVRAAIDRAAGPPSSDYSMLAARFDLAEGNVDQARARLDEVVATGDATLPDALLERVEASLAQGDAVAADLVTLLDGLAFQHRGTEQGRRLVDASIRARASGGAFEAAFETLEAASGNGTIAPERDRALRRDIFVRLASDADDVGFLQLVIPRLDASAGLPAETRRAIATRLLDLGFARPAQQVLDGNGAVPEAADRRLFARAALTESRPEVAVGYLAGLEDPVAKRLRAEAMEMARDHAAAVRIFDEVGDREAGLRSAWRGGLWSEVAEHDAGAEGAAARLMIGDPAAIPEVTAPESRVADAPSGQDAAVPPSGVSEDPTGMAPAPHSLGAGRALIDRSRSTREALRALLDRVGDPAEEPGSGPGPGS